MNEHEEILKNVSEKLTKSRSSEKNSNHEERKSCSSQPSVLNDLLFLFLKVAMIGMFLVLFFTFMFGICQVQDTTMDPAVKEGDLAIYYRLQKNYSKNDVIIVNYNGEPQIRRVVAIPGDTVDMDERGLVINGYSQIENEIYTRTEPYVDGITFPITLAQDEVFVLGDNRPKAVDSRMYGAVKISATKGQLMTLIRRRNL